MSKNNFRPPDTTEALTEQLKGKSRSRRANLKRLAAPAAAARAMRNDVLPNLEIVIVALSELRSAPRKVRKCDPAHVREVAGSISALGFCSPILIGDDNVVLDGEIRVEAVRLLGPRQRALHTHGSSVRRLSSACCVWPSIASPKRGNGTSMS